MPCNVKVSIITITHNSASTLRDTIQSVVSQTYKDIEYIIVDGLSTDNSMEIVKEYKDRISRVVSEKDHGLYDALNKGIKLATGDVVGIIHSDDFYTSEHVIANIVSVFEKENPEAVYADLYYVDKEDTHKIFRKWKSGEYKHGMFLHGWMPPHPTFFVKRCVYEQHGGFNLQLKSAADYELMLRFIHKHKIAVAYLPEFIIKMRVGGKSNKSVKNRIKANQEDRNAWKINGLKPKLHTLYLKPLRKIIQLFRK